MGRPAPHGGLFQGPPVDKRQYRAVWVISLVVVFVTGALYLSGSTAFRPYFGMVNPVLATCAVVLAGATSLVLLRRLGWFSVLRERDGGRGLFVATGLATLLVAPAILLDVLVRFPEDMNAPWPEAFLFYPAVGYVAETVFHTFPLAILLLAIGHLFAERRREQGLWSVMLVVAMIEPFFQTALAPQEFPVWAVSFMALHLFVFNAVQLWVFKRLDFLSMYWMRLVYYLHWHLLWGFARLHLFF